EGVLHRYLSCADVCINLRDPAMEGGSASLVEGLYFGRPMVVTDTGCYRDVPDHCVAKIPPGDEAASLGGVLKTLVEDGARREALGRAGRAHVLENHSPAKYARGLLDFLHEVDYGKPRLDLVDRVGRELAAMKALPGGADVRRVAAEL